MSGILNIPVEMTSRSPQSANIGIHHDFNNGHALAFDLVWIDFSNFSLSEFYFDGNTIVETDPVYEDITAISVGYNFPVGERWRLGLGAFVTDEMIADDNRTMMLRLDSATSYGIGAEYTTRKGTAITVNLSYLDFGDAPVTSPDLPILGEISGVYTKRDTYYLQVSAAFGGKPR
jgi:long-subunit fatty acid transport protein